VFNVIYTTFGTGAETGVCRTCRNVIYFFGLVVQVFPKLDSNPFCSVVVENLLQSTASRRVVAVHYEAACF
jgi:hypothetical protein